MSLNLGTGFAAGAGFILLAAAPLLLWLNPRAPANRAFSLLLVAHGGWFTVFGLALVLDGVASSRLLLSIAPVFAIAMPFALFHFVTVYPRRRAWVPASLPVWVLVWVPAAVPMALVALRPSLFWDIGWITAETAALSFPLPPFTTFGAAAFWGFKLSFLVAGLVLFRDYILEKPGIRRVTMLFVALGLFAPSSCTCAVQVILLKGLYFGFIMGGADPLPGTSVAASMVEELLVIAMNVLVLWILVLLVKHAFWSDDRDVRARVKPFLFLVVAAILGSLYSMTPARFESGWWSPWGWGLEGFWQVAGLVLVGYAIARHRLFDIDIKIKSAVQRSTLVGVFLAVFFMVTVTAENFLTDRYGWAFGGVGAGLLLFALTPLERLGKRIANMAMPSTRSLDELAPSDKETLFMEQLRLVWMDGSLTPKDRVVIANLRARLEIASGVAERLEMAVVEEARLASPGFAGGPDSLSDLGAPERQP
ncbi:MAG: hypothetical protein KY455_10425 [Euryarchaeota archaeon]|nr:hypothetical protein [Euryarchaeota archaeon]